MENEIYVVEHSNKQKCFNIETLKNVLKLNIKNVYEPFDSDYQIIYIGNYTKCKDFIKNMKYN